MALLRNFPLLVIPLIIYNLIAQGLVGLGWSSPVFSFSMVSGAVFTLNQSGLIILLALFLLFFEIVKATRTAQATIVDHLLSTIVFIVYLLQFVIDPRAATTPFFLCTMIAFLDVVAGYTISIRVASRDVTFEQGLR